MRCGLQISEQQRFQYFISNSKNIDIVDEQMAHVKLSTDFSIPFMIKNVV